MARKGVKVRADLVCLLQLCIGPMAFCRGILQLACHMASMGFPLSSLLAPLAGLSLSST